MEVGLCGELVITGDCSKIIGELCSVFEKVMRGNTVADLDVRLNLKRGGGGRGESSSVVSAVDISKELLTPRSIDIAYLICYNLEFGII